MNRSLLAGVAAAALAIMSVAASAAPAKVEAKPKAGSHKADAAKKGEAKPAEDKQASQDQPAVKVQVEPRPPADGPLLASQLKLGRVTDSLAQGPVTHAVTRHGDWSVACEIKEKVKACFASTYYGTDGLVMKLKVGPSEIETPTRKRKRGDERFVLSIEGPSGLDPNVGYAVVLGSRSGMIPTGNDCDREGCRSYIEIAADGSPLFGEGVRPGISVMAASRTGAYVWRFSTDGLPAAFAQMKDETRPSGPSEEEIRAKREAEVAEARAKEERARLEAEAEKAKLTGIQPGWEAGKSATMGDGKKIRIIDISSEGQKAAASPAALESASAAPVPVGPAPVVERSGARPAPKAPPKAAARIRKPAERMVERPFVPQG